jgi:hypothetical protein
MSVQQKVPFQTAIEIIESLPEYQQENLIDIIKHRLIEQRRDSIAENIKIAREEYAAGKVYTGSVNDIMKEIAP